jgi:hypothetical protein
MWDFNDILKIRYTKSNTFFVEFDNGQKGEINFEEFLQGPIFKPLHDKKFFRKARI